MKKSLFLRILAGLLVFTILMTGCTESNVAPPSIIEQSVVENSVAEAAESVILPERENNLRPADGLHVLGGLTEEQRLEDYEYFWETIRGNYPFLGVAERSGIDADKIYEEYKAKISGDITDTEYIGQLFYLGREFNSTGHMNLAADYEDYRYFLDAYREIDAPHCQYIYDRLNNPLSREAYWRMNPNANGKEESIEEDGMTLVADENNLTLDIFEEGNIAVVKIKSFGYENIEPDREKIMPFYEEIKDYNHLIIDITENGGGSDNYWNQLIVNLLLKEDTTSTEYLLFNNTDEIRAYAQKVGIYDLAQPIEELPEFPNLNLDDRETFTHFVKQTFMLEGNDQTEFDGKIWVLTSDYVYSASESFVMFCKNTGFATLVGEQTGGDGGGADPFVFVLPNSGLFWRNSVFYGINSDGSNNEEYGTMPDIPAGNRTPLDACLEAIIDHEAKE